MKLHFKFASGASEKDRAGLVDNVRRCGVRSIEPLFPGEEDRELAAIQVVEAGDAAAERVLEILQNDEAVDFAESEPVRKLL